MSLTKKLYVSGELTSPRMILMTPERETRVSKHSKETTTQPESLLYGHPTLVSSPSGSLDFLLCSPPRLPRREISTTFSSPPRMLLPPLAHTLSSTTSTATTTRTLSLSAAEHAVLPFSHPRTVSMPWMFPSQDAYLHWMDMLGIGVDTSPRLSLKRFLWIFFASASPACDEEDGGGKKVADDFGGREGVRVAKGKGRDFRRWEVGSRARALVGLAGTAVVWAGLRGMEAVLLDAWEDFQPAGLGEYGDQVRGERERAVAALGPWVRSRPLGEGAGEAELYAWALQLFLQIRVSVLRYRRRNKARMLQFVESSLGARFPTGSQVLDAWGWDQSVFQTITSPASWIAALGDSGILAFPDVYAKPPILSTTDLHTHTRIGLYDYAPSVFASLTAMRPFPASFSPADGMALLADLAFAASQQPS